MLSNIYQLITIPAGGGTTTITTGDGIGLYIVDSTNGLSVTLAGNYTIAYSGTPIEGNVCEFDYRGIVVLNGFNITILGRTLTQYEAVSKLRVQADWDSTLGQWNVILIKENNNNIYKGVVELTMGTSGTTTIYPGITKSVIYIQGSPVLVGNVAYTPGGTPKDGDQFIVYYQANPTLGAFNVTIFGLVLDSYEAANGQIVGIYTYSSTSSAWFGGTYRDTNYMNIKPSDVLHPLDKFLVTVPCSFVTANQCTNKVLYIPGKYAIIKASGIVTAALSNTDAGTITIKGDATTAVTLTFPLSSALDTIVTATNGAAITNAAQTHISATSAKTTSGGAVLVTIECQWINN